MATSRENEATFPVQELLNDVPEDTKRKLMIYGRQLVTEPFQDICDLMITMTSEERESLHFIIIQLVNGNAFLLEKHGQVKVSRSWWTLLDLLSPFMKEADLNSPEELEVFCEYLILHHFQKRKYGPPIGINFNTADITLDSDGQYSQYQVDKELYRRIDLGVLVRVIRDWHTGARHVMKTIELGNFKPNEPLALVELKSTRKTPELKIMKQHEGKVIYIMEWIDGFTLVAIKVTIKTLCRDFVLCILHELLTALKEIHDKGWSYNDITYENIILDRNSLLPKFVDLGEARKHVNAFILDKEKDIRAAIYTVINILSESDFTVFSTKEDILHKLMDSPERSLGTIRPIQDAIRQILVGPNNDADYPGYLKQTLNKARSEILRYSAKLHRR